MILIVGMARSGLAAARLLHSRGEDVFVTDSGKPKTTADLDALGISWESGGHTMDNFLSADEIIVSPGVPSNIAPLVAAREKGIPIVSELEIAWRYLKGDVIAITGSNGKTTTTTLVGDILKSAGRPVQVGGNIGTAMCGLVDTSTPTSINVIEVSSFQLDGTHMFRPKVAGLLNITPDHLDRYPDFEAYRASKFRIFRNQQPTDAAVLNQDDPQVCPQPVEIRARKSHFSRKGRPVPGAYRAESALFLNGTRVLPVDEVRVRGEHNIENILAAMAITADYDIPVETLATAIHEFRGVEHRIEFSGTFRGIEFFNDSKATNVDSSIKAVEAFPGNILLILGGKDKGAPYEALFDAMRAKVKHVLLIGEAAEKIASAMGNQFPCTRVASLSDAVKRAADIGTTGDIVLLSPACASFDMFDNFEHRGREFKKAVQELMRNA
jgi:UDP-N-acetylmuramoylalanine--D-glutamate ligase